MSVLTQREDGNLQPGRGLSPGADQADRSLLASRTEEEVAIVHKPAVYGP